MDSFSDRERQAVAALIELAIAEDLGEHGDITSESCISATSRGRAAFVSRQAGVLAGSPVCAMVLRRIDPKLLYETIVPDGAPLEAMTRIATIEGSMRSILAAERITLNFLQHLSGIASLTRQYVDAAAGYRAKILDTRKTLPGWRILEKYAVRMGGGVNHRLGLHDGILIKDNHLAALADPQKAIERAVATARQAYPHLPIEIEVDSLEQLEQALSAKADIVLLDNMDPSHLRAAVQRRDEKAPQVQLEASGGVNLKTVRGIAETGVDRISVGALTHSAPALDIGLDYYS